MTKRKFRVQWVAVFCLVALLAGVFSVLFFRNSATAADISGKGLVDDFSGYEEGVLYKRTPADYTNCIDKDNWGERLYAPSFKASSGGNAPWAALIFNGNEDTTPKEIGSNIAKSIGVETVEGNDGGKALKLTTGYVWAKSGIRRANDSICADLTASSSLTDGNTLYLRFRFMVPNTTTAAEVYPKAQGTCPGEFIKVEYGNLIIARTTTLSLQPGHWYDVVWYVKAGTKTAAVYVDGVGYQLPYYTSTPDNISTINNITFQAYPTATEGGESILYVDDVALYERVGDFSALKDRMEVTSSDYDLSESGISLLGDVTVGDLLQSFTMRYDVTAKLFDGTTEVTDKNAVVRQGNTLRFETLSGSYRVNIPVRVLEDRPADKEVYENFNGISFVIDKSSEKDGSYYKNSSTELLTGVTAASTFGDGDSLSVARAPFKRAGDAGLIFRSEKTSTSASMTILRNAAFPYATRYGHVLEFDVIATGESGALTVERSVVSDTVTVTTNSIIFGNNTLTLEANRYHHIVWGITVEGVQSVYADGTLVGTKNGSALKNAGGVTFRMTKTEATTAEFAVDSLNAYCKASAYRAETDTSYPLSDVMNVTESTRTFYIQGANFDAAYLLGTFTEGDVALYDKDGNEVTSGNFDRKTGLLVYYPANDGTPKVYTLGNPSFSFSSIYADGMVLQRNKNITLTGFANASGIDAMAALTDKDGNVVALASAKTVAGQFEITLPPMAAAKGLSLNIRIFSGSEVFYERTFSDVAIGEVWILSGQSNMALRAIDLEDAAQYLANADNYGDNIRYYTQARVGSFTPEKDTQNGGWYVASEENLRSHEISGIGYVMATRLAEELGDVPVAIINAYYAGSSIVAWFDLDTIEAEYPDLYQTYLAKKAAGTPSSWNTIPSVCYNRLVHPIKGYTASGLLWYQGESDCGKPDLYGGYYKTLTSLWREWLHDDELPFVVMQLAPFPGNSYPAFRNLQYNMVQDDPHSYLITTMDDGPVFNAADNRDGFGYSHVHPAKKSGIGLRTADLILGEVYGVDLGRAHKAPEVISVTRDGASVVLTFDTDLTLLYGGAVTGFTLDGVAAVGKIDGKTLTLTAAGITAPTKVAYAQDTITVVMADGTIYRNVTNIHVGNDADANRQYADRSYTTFDVRMADGTTKTVTVGAGSHDVIRTTYGGNLTNESGYALPAFSLTVSAE